MIILTGGAGFIGSNILRRLNDEGRDNVIVVDNLKNADKYRNLVGLRFQDLIAKEEFYERLDKGEFDSYNIEAISHQGACTDTMEYDGTYMMRTNYEASKSLLHLALKKRVPFVYASTAAVYGHTSEAIEQPSAEAPLNIYGFSKLAFDNYVRRFAQDAPSVVVGLRYFNVYGNGEQHKGRMSSMIYQLAQQIERSGVAKIFGAVGPFGPGEQTRDFVYVNDLVDMNMFFLDRDPVCAIVNAGSGVRSTWNQMAQAVIEALGKGTIEYVDFPESLKEKYQFDTRANLTRLRELGFDRQLTPLREGVSEYLHTMSDRTERFRPKI